MTPAKCPNCRLSLPQNWSGSNEPNAKCPYCGKPVAPGAAAPGPSAPQPPQPVPAPAPKAAAKTILWGAGVPIPGRTPAPPAPAPQPLPRAVPQPVSPAPPPAAPPPAPSAAKDALADAPTLNRNAVAEPAPAARPAPSYPAAPAPEAGDIEVDVSEASAPEPAPLGSPASKPNPPAPTVMFESGIHPAAPPADAETLSAQTDTGAASEEAEQSEPPEEPVSRPTPTRSKYKGKQAPRKIYKPKSGLAGKRAGADDDAELAKPASSRTGLVVFLVLLACGAAVIAFVLLRGGGIDGGDKPAAKAKPLVEPTSVPSEEPAAAALAPPAAAPAAAEKPAPAEKPAAAERPVRAAKPPAERPLASEKPKAGPPSVAPEPKASGGKPSEEDYRRANEAYQRGNAKLFTGNTTEAIAEFSQALRLNPKDPANHRGLGLAYAQAGKTREAIRHLKLYLRAAPKASDRPIIERKLDQLKGQ